MKSIFLILLLGIFSCQNNSTEQVKKEAPTEKDENDYWEKIYKKYGDADKYQQWFFEFFDEKTIAVPSFIDTLSDGNVLFGIQSPRWHPVLFCVKDIRDTKKFYSIFQLHGFPNDSKGFSDGVNQQFNSETKESQDKMKYIFKSFFQQIKFYPYDILRFLEKKTVNDTLSPNAIEEFFDKVFSSIKNPKNEYGFKSLRFDKYELLFNKDIKNVSIKKFLETKTAKKLPDYERIKYILYTAPNCILSYEIKKNTYVLIFKSPKIHDVEIHVFGELINYWSWE
jgi:hypothetical protein